MKLFGRRQGGEPAAQTPPPELRAFYGMPSRAARARQMLFVLLCLITVAAIAVAGGAWWRHAHEHPTPPATIGQTQQPKSGTNGTPEQENGNNSTGQSGEQAPPAAPSPTTLPSDTGNTPTPPPGQSEIANTGPGSTAIVAALVLGALAAAANYTHRLLAVRFPRR